MNCLKPEKEGNLLNLPEELIRVIFSFLTDSEVYFRVRCVCHQLQVFAEKYVQIGNYFIILSLFIRFYEKLQELQ